ncbi:MAG: hypothetical protein ABSB35_29995 [Bryobacteraceae bacterium]|jgi:hypothetical protein
MTQEQRDTLEYAHFRISRALELLLQPHTDLIAGIDAIRKAVVAAQQAVDKPLEEATRL